MYCSDRVYQLNAKDISVDVRCFQSVKTDYYIQGRSDGGYIGIYTPQNQSTLNFLCGCFVSLQWLVNIYTHPNQIPGYASDYIIDGLSAKYWLA